MLINLVKNGLLKTNHRLLSDKRLSKANHVLTVTEIIIEARSLI